MFCMALTVNAGSILSGGGSVPAPNATAIQWENMTDTFQAAALSTRLKIPIIYGIDAVHGHNNVYGATIFPHNVGLGCTRYFQSNDSIVKELCAIPHMWWIEPKSGAWASIAQVLSTLLHVNSLGDGKLPKIVWVLCLGIV